jgi:hypothetical protein
MLDENNELLDNVIWFNNMSDLPDMLADVIASWMQDEIPELIWNGMAETNTRYTKKVWDENVDKLIGEIVSTRIDELCAFKDNINKNKNEEEK